MLSHYAGAPQYGMEFRSYYMAKEWVKQGHNVLIVGASFSHLRKIQPKSGYEEIDGIKYLWLETRTYEGSGMARVITMFQFVFKCYKHIREFVAFKPDMVIASSVYTFDMFPANRIAKKTGAKFVYEVHDLWPLSPMIIGGYSKWHPFIWLLQKGENFAYKHCDKIVSMLDKSFPHMEELGLTKDRFCCVPNGYLKEEWENVDAFFLPAEHRNLFDKLHNNGKLVIGFAGGHTPSTAMGVLIEAANMLKNRTDLAYVLVGQGPQKEELIELAKSYGLSNVFFLDPVNKKSVPAIVSNFDIGYMGGIHSFLHKYGTSFNKMTDYMLSSKPIIMSVDEPNSVVERIGCGIQVEAENPTLVKIAIEKLSSLSQKQRFEMGNKGKAYAEANLEYGTLAKKFINEVMA
mgnify:CR=1 FL=1